MRFFEYLFWVFVAVLAYRSCVAPLIYWNIERRLKNKVQETLPFLFDDFDARFVRNGHGRNLYRGNLITMVVKNVRITIGRHHGAYSADIAASALQKGEWMPLEYALIAVGDQRLKAENGKGEYSSILNIAKLLEPQFAKVNEAYDESNLSATRERLRVIQKCYDERWPSVAKS